jgi:hypothetical protein
LIVEENQDAKKINPDDVLVFNPDFAIKALKFKVPLPKVTAKRTTSGLTEHAEQQRKFVLDAAIVRIMKARKTLVHSDLIIEVIEQLKLFKPTPKSIKMQIEDLITRDFLERDATKNMVYKLSTIYLLQLFIFILTFVSCMILKCVLHKKNSYKA